jgi:pilus assembly protein Flp/PilA
MNTNPVSVRHARCTFCGGKGPDLQAERVINPVTKAHYLVPLSHTACKESILSLSLSLSLSMTRSKPMTTIYFKSLDEKTVLSLRGPNPQPAAAPKEYIQVSKTEFFRLKKIIRNTPAILESGEIKFHQTEHAQGLVEYALILVLVAVVVIAVLLVLGPMIGNVFTQINSSLMQ